MIKGYWKTINYEFSKNLVEFIDLYLNFYSIYWWIDNKLFIEDDWTCKKHIDWTWINDYWQRGIFKIKKSYCIEWRPVIYSEDRKKLFEESETKKIIYDFKGVIVSINLLEFEWPTEWYRWAKPKWAVIEIIRKWKKDFFWKEDITKSNKWKKEIVDYFNSL